MEQEMQADLNLCICMLASRLGSRIPAPVEGQNLYEYALSLCDASDSIQQATTSGGQLRPEALVRRQHDN